MVTTNWSQFGQYVKLIRDNPRKQRVLYLGDSWFQYPLRRFADLQTRIDTRFRTHALGLDDSYPGRDADETMGLIGRWRGFAAELARIRRPFNLICVSMGGNDIIGRDFAQHLFKQPTNQPPFEWPWSDSIPDIVLTRISIKSLREAFDTVAFAYGLIFKLRDDFAPGATVITHTYADVTPSNTPYTFLGIKAGPWIWKPLTGVGIKDPALQREITRWLLLSFANMMASVASQSRKVVVLDTREELPDFDGWWDNEIHPLGPGFKLLAEEYWFPAVRKALGVA
jgi:hypothetical protein